ncbi:hypothetical protein K502DRAFT_324859 [Neoconidiobolus thromboides FSU 785]|nr:hypothetical protein K502DRAFT_324859 [Neoconidiobolus thromboides FSU 785]
MQECESSCVKKNSQPAKKEEPKTNSSFSQESCKVEIPDVIFNPLVKFDRKCYIKTDSGMCRGAFPSYHFDPSKGKCVEDVYGGCGGCLAFTSIEECNSTCRTH